MKENTKSNNRVNLMAFLSYIDFIQYGIDCLLEYDMVRFFLIYNSYLNDIDYATGVAEYIQSSSYHIRPKTILAHQINNSNDIRIFEATSLIKDNYHICYNLSHSNNPYSFSN